MVMIITMLITARVGIVVFSIPIDFVIAVVVTGLIGRMCQREIATLMASSIPTSMIMASGSLIYSVKKLSKVLYSTLVISVYIFRITVA